MTINGKTLRRYRDSKSFSQSDLAEHSGVSKKTISRIELGEIDRPNKATKEKLAKALEIKVSDLAKSADEREEVEHNLKKMGYRKLNVLIDSETAVAYAMAQKRYGVSARALIDMAPLFFSLLAEGSLQWRKQKADALSAAVDAVRSASEGAPHLAYASSIYHADDGLDDEYRSITTQDIFGEKINDEVFNFGFNPSQNNPFADYLRHLCKDMDAAALEIDPNGPGYWKVDDCMPEFRIAPEEFNAITGNDTWAEFAIERDHVRISDIPSSLMGKEREAERIEWLVSKVPDEARKEHQELLDLLSALELKTEKSETGNE